MGTHKTKHDSESLYNNLYAMTYVVSDVVDPSPTLSISHVLLVFGGLLPNTTLFRHNITVWPLHHINVNKLYMYRPTCTCDGEQV